MVFIAPVVGARTSNSEYTRSELREMNGSHQAAWSLAEGGTMTAEVAVQSVPIKADGTSGKVVVRQVHGKHQELCRLYFDGHTAYFVDDKAGPGNAPAMFFLRDAKGHEPSLSVGEKFDYSIQVGRHSMTVKAFTNNTIYEAFDPISPAWRADKFYFKAGVYNGVGAPGSGAATVGSGTGSVAFYQLVVHHPNGGPASWAG